MQERRTAALEQRLANLATDGFGVHTGALQLNSLLTVNAQQPPGEHDLAAAHAAEGSARSAVTASDVGR